MLWQLPATFTRDDERLAGALDALPPGRHAFEFRDPSWFHDDVRDLLRSHDVALVLADDLRRPLPEIPSPTAWSYVRWHYGHRGRDGNYGPKELDAWRAVVERRARGGHDVYGYFNNDWTGYAPRNAAGLMERLDVTAYHGTCSARASSAPR